MAKTKYQIWTHGSLSMVLELWIPIHLMDEQGGPARKYRKLGK